MKTTTKNKNLKKGDYEVIETIVNVDGISANTYGIDNGKLRVEDISLDKSRVSNFANLLNADGNVNDAEILHEMIYDLIVSE